MKNSLSFLVQQLLFNNDISLDKKELEFQIRSHPSYPSLHAVTGVLDHFNIDNLALEVPVDEKILSQLPKCFLAQVTIDRQDTFAVVINQGLKYTLIVSKKEKKTVTVQEFISMFTGIIVAVEKTDLTEESNSHNDLNNKVLVALTVSAIFALYLMIKPEISSFLFFLASILGVIISIALKKQEQGQKTLLGNAFCSGESEKKDCDSVLTSKGAFIYKNFKLSDLSLIYFSGLTTSVFILNITNLSLSLPYVIALFGIPVSLYSIYYQAVVVKKWCFLCLSVVGVLWAQIAIVGFNMNFVYGIQPSTNSFLIIAFGFLSAFAIWNFLSPNLAELQELKQIKIDHIKFKRNFGLFNSLLEKSDTINTYIEDSSEIVLGNSNAHLELTIVTSPFCGHCKPVHSLIEDILKKHSDQIKIQVRFNANYKDTNDDLTKITSRLIDIYHIEGSDKCLNAMHDIYNNRKPEQWFKTYGICDNQERALNSLEKQSEWCISNGLNFTPVILINGKSFPKEYERTDLIYFVEDLNEHFEQMNVSTVMPSPSIVT